MFQFTGFASTDLCIQSGILLAEWVSPFGHRGINACCQLLRAFRRLPRPSSPLTAKASTVDAYSLDHITRSCLQVRSTLNISPNCLNDTSKLGESSDACYVPSCQRAQTRPQRLAGIKSFCVRSYIQKESMVGLGGLEPPTSPLSGARSNHLSYRPGQLSQSLGGADRDRTDDPLLAKQVLSQLSYSPEGLKGGFAALLDICRLLVWTPWNGEVVLERR